MLIDFRQLFPKYGLKPVGVLHIGANIGEERDVYKELGIVKQIWVEANPEIYAKLIQNVSDNKYAMCLCMAAGEETRIAMLNVSNNAGQSSSLLELGTHKEVHPEVHYTKTINVPMVRMDSLLTGDMSEYEFLNIDVQGYELQVLKGLGKLLNGFKAIYLEVNWKELYVGCALIGEVDDYLRGFGFYLAESKQCGNTFWGDALFLKR